MEMEINLLKIYKNKIYFIKSLNCSIDEIIAHFFANEIFMV